MPVPKTFRDRPRAAAQFRAIVDYARRNNPFYRSWITDPEEVPILDRFTFLENNDAILNGRQHNGSTSGSTGVPVRYFHTKLRASLSARDVDRFVVGLGGRLPCVRIIYPNSKKPDPSLLNIKSPIDEQIAFIQKRHQAGRAQAITTYPTNAEMLAREVIERGIDMSFIRRFGLFSENVEPYQKQMVAQAFPNARIWTSYSSMEFGMIAAQCPYEADFHHLMAHRLGVEVLDDEGQPAAEGKRGRIVITDYRNKMSPFIRYELGDYAVREACPCGKITLPSLSKIFGKVRGALLHRNGERVLFTDLSVALRDMEGMRQYQVVQDAVEDFTVKIVSKVNLDEGIRAAFQAHFGYLPEKLLIDYVDEIPRGDNGKYYASICKIEEAPKVVS